jgi:hypothetical protein
MRNKRKSGPDRKPIVPGLPTNRARLFNRPAHLAGDGRGAAARFYRDTVLSIASDRGGVEVLSQVQIELIRRFAGISTLARQMEADIAAGKTVNISEFSALASALCRLSSRIGLNRAMKKVPDLRDYIEGRASIDNGDDA